MTRLDPSGGQERDTVARRENQRNDVVDSDTRVRVVRVHAGHAGVLGNGRDVPHAFWAMLDAGGLLAGEETPRLPAFAGGAGHDEVDQARPLDERTGPTGGAAR